MEEPDSTELTSPSMFRATFTVARRVPKEGATSESKVGVVKLRANRKLYSARSRDCKARQEHSKSSQGPHGSLLEAGGVAQLVLVPGPAGSGRHLG